MGAKRISKNELSQIINLYKSGITFRDIGKSIGRTHSCVIENLIDAGVYKKGEPLLNADARKKKRQTHALKMGAKNKSDHRKHYENCIKCLAKIGYGKRVIARILNIDLALSSNVIKLTSGTSKRMYHKWKSQTDLSKEKKINQIIAMSLRSRVRDALKTKGVRKNFSARGIIGCDLNEFRKHIESKFTHKMSWHNYGKNWHLDHIVPCAKFDLQNTEHLKICFHYTNYRPLNARRNMRENSRKKLNQQLPLPL